MNKHKLTQENYNAMRDHLFDHMHKDGQQLKNVFPNSTALRWAICRSLIVFSHL
jgi:hypothetical protein